jgi:sugar lactone lactonase YvrE
VGSGARFSSPLGVCVDDAGNVYVADAGNHLIRKVMPSGAVATLAGLAGGGGNVDGVWDDARFQHPSGIAVDKLGNLYVADTGNHTVRKEILEAVPNSPGLVWQPQGQTVTAGATVSFYVTAYGMEPLTYQWQKDGQALSGATNTTLSLTQVLRADSGAYTVAVSNAVGHLLSSNATLCVKSPQRLAWTLPSDGGHSQLRLQDADGAVAPLDYASAFVVQASTNLLDWLPLLGNFSSTNGWLLFEEADAVYWPRRFYRVIEQ